MTHYGLRISEYRACRACTCALAPAADEYNLNVVDCNALSLSHAGLPSQSVGVWGVPPAAGGKRTAGGKRKMVFRGLPRACWEFSFLFFFEYNLNVVDCNASVTVARWSSISVSGGLGGTPSQYSVFSNGYQR